MSDIEDEALTADQLMDRLRVEAGAAADNRRLGTLSRLVEACDDFLSGEAYRKAKSARREPEFFNPNFQALNSNRVEQYVRLRGFLEGGNTSWTGPVATTIRADKNLMAYLKLREQEAKRPGKPKSRGPRSRKLEEIVDGLQSITDQAALRQALADGRKWKRELDILLAALRRLPAIDVDALREGTVLSPTTVTGAPTLLAPEDSKTLRRLLARLQDSDGLSEFGLVFRNGRVKMDFAPGTDLVMPEEILLLARLADIEIAAPAG
jgi:hypothetical protein